MSTIKLPSNFQIGEVVKIDLFGFRVDKAIIKKVHFSESKTMYDLDVMYEFFNTAAHPAGWGTTRIYNVDSALVTSYEGIIEAGVNQDVDVVIINRETIGRSNTAVFTTSEERKNPPTT